MTTVPIYPADPTQLRRNGRLAARTLWERWDERPEVDDPLHTAFADGALAELELRQRTTPGVLREVLRYAEAGAEQLGVEPFHGLLEVVQNADDLGATRVNVAVRRSSPDELVMAHDGGRVTVRDVLAMTFAFLSTKRADPRSKGRFGIGLKTLNQLGDELVVHGPPYHFAVAHGQLRAVEPSPAIRGIYRGEEGETLLRLRLNGELGAEQLQDWFRALDATVLLFLDTVRSFSLLDLKTGRADTHLTLEESAPATCELELAAANPTCHMTLLKDPTSGTTWQRYRIDYPVPKSLSRAHKATDTSTPLAVALASNPAPARVSAGLPLPVPSQLPLAVNAQFDPDTARAGIRHVRWNEWLFDRLADLTAAVALQRFQETPREGWLAVPLLRECAGGNDAWVQSSVERFTRRIHDRLRARLRLEIEGQHRRLSDLVYEEGGLEEVFSPEDQRALKPSLWPIPGALRDGHDRWRLVLEDLGSATKLTARDALEMLEWSDERLGNRPARWFVSLANAALEEQLDLRLCWLPSVKLADGRRVAPGSAQSLLVERADAHSLAGALGLEMRVAVEYLEADAAPTRVRTWLREDGYLLGESGPSETLALLAKRGSDEPLHLSDEQLLLLRDALRHLPEWERARTGRAVGEVVTVDGYEWKDDERVRHSVRPCRAYLPNQIGRERGLSWSRGAAMTEGLEWVDPRYLRIFRTGDRDEARARRFFALLGAELAPRLYLPPASLREERRGEPAYEVDRWTGPALQRNALNALSGWRAATHLQGDRVAPDLERVVADISKRRVDKERRERGRALFETLARHWDRLYAANARATAVYSDYVWRSAGTVPATWIARAAAEPWLSDKRGKPRIPSELAIETATTRLVRGTDRSQYVFEVREDDIGTPLVSALGIKGSAPASELLAELTALRTSHATETEWHDLYPLYAELAALCPRRDPQAADRVGDVDVARLRREFAEGGGLVLTRIGWLPPSRVFAGRAIFGDYAAFVPDHARLRPLWRALRIERPTIDDCLRVLGRVAKEGGNLRASARDVLVDTFRHIDSELDGDDPTPALRRRLRKLPLWTTKGWMVERPIFAVADRSLEPALGLSIVLWSPGCVIDSLGGLPALLDVTLLDETTFSVDASDDARSADATLVELFGSAVDRLRSYAADADQQLWESCDWEALRSLSLREAPKLCVKVRAGERKRVVVDRAVHVDRSAGILYFRDETALGDLEAGGRAIASIFQEGQREVALAWAECWRQAASSEGPVSVLRLAEAEQTEPDPLEPLATAGKKASRARLFAGGAVAPTRPQVEIRDGLPSPDTPRSLKDFSSAVIGDVRIESGTEPSKTVTRLRGRVPLRDDLPQPPAPSGRPFGATKDWTDAERETLGFALLAAALKQIDGSELEDFRALHGIGADSVDQLRRYFELKAYTGEMPDEVRLESSQFERAGRATSAYFLAVVSGLEEGHETLIRIIPNPVRELEWRRRPAMTLSGIRHARALVIPVEMSEGADDATVA